MMKIKSEKLKKNGKFFVNWQNKHAKMIKREKYIASIAVVL